MNRTLLIRPKCGSPRQHRIDADERSLVTERQMLNLAPAWLKTIGQSEQGTCGLRGIGTHHCVGLKARVVRSGCTVAEKQHAVHEERGASRSMPRKREHLDRCPRNLHTFSIMHTTRHFDAARFDGRPIGLEDVNLRSGERLRAADVIVVLMREKNTAHVGRSLAHLPERCDDGLCVGIGARIDQPYASIFQIEDIRANRNGAKMIRDHSSDTPAGKRCAILEREHGILHKGDEGTNHSQNETHKDAQPDHEEPFPPLCR